MVNIFNAALEVLYPRNFAPAKLHVGSPFIVREPSPLDTLTMRGQELPAEEAASPE